MNNLKSVQPGVLTVASAYPDPPFELVVDGQKTGFDIAMMQAIAAALGLTLRRVEFEGADFDGIFSGLQSGQYDAVSSGTTITPDRAQQVLFSEPYLEFNQGVAINHDRTPHVAGANDLRGLVAGIQKGNTSEFVAQRWLREGQIASIRYYPYDGISDALKDLANGEIGLLVKLFPVISWLVKDAPSLSVAFQVPTHEQLGIAFAKDNQPLCDAVNGALTTLKANGALDKLHAAWLAPDASKEAPSC
jgi:polar amino acid transport system substrate-binding protein